MSAPITKSFPEYPLLPLTTKLFEYLAAQRPILAVTKRNSEMAQILKTTKSGKSFEFQEDTKIEEFIKFEYETFCRTNKPRRLNNDDLISGYDRKLLTEKIAILLRSVVASA
jgi:hypothetical protein